LKKSRMCVERKELASTLRLAGKYLSSVQMDMERLKDDAAVAASRTLAARTAAAARATGTSERVALEAASDAGAEPAPAAEAVGAVEDAEAPPCSSPWAADSTAKLPLPTVPEQGGDLFSMLALPWNQVDSVASVVVTASGDKVADTDAATDNASANAAVGCVSNAAVMDEIEDDDAGPLLFPTFGEFMDKQLVPLYIADIPFPNLTYLSERYCGVPLDSDDEEQAWKLIGRPSLAPAPAKRRQLKGRRTGGTSAPSDPPRPFRGPTRTLSETGTIDADVSPSSCRGIACTTAKGSSGNVAPETPLKGLLRADREPRLRSQMVTSVAEKRRKGCVAARDMDLERDLLRVLRVDKKAIRGGFAGALAIVKHDAHQQETGLPNTIAANPLFCSPAPARMVALKNVASPLSTRAVRFRGLESTRKRKLEPHWDLLDS
jgi:hypothetical protein